MKFRYKSLLISSIIGMGIFTLPFNVLALDDEPKQFTMVFMSDPQLEWGCGDEGNSLSNYCVEGVKKNNNEIQAIDTNNLHVNAIKYIMNKKGSNFKGVVINGDLTQFGSQNNRLEQFANYYLTLNTNVWPGLGNHDYQNNLADCGKAGLGTYNYCAANMVYFMANWITNHVSSIKSFDLPYYSKNNGQGDDRPEKNLSGSLAYSWEIGKFHFVQLNNYPEYQATFTSGYDHGVHSWDIYITSPDEWLKKDLKDAVDRDKVIILNWHRYHDIYGTKKPNDIELTHLQEILKDYKKNIKAIFVGHAHDTYGHSLPGSPNSNASMNLVLDTDTSVPVIYGGSAIYNRFVQADFDGTEGNCSITTQVINTFTDPPTNAPSSDQNDSGKYVIDCNINKP